MVLINGNWEEIRDLEDVSKIIREYFNEDLSYELDKLIPSHSDEGYDELKWELEEKESENESLKDEIETLENKVEILEEKIDELENK